MPLPPALLERLKRRKIIQLKDDNDKGTDATLQDDQHASSKSVDTEDRNLLDSNEQEEEEIIAEDYSDEKSEVENSDEDGESISQEEEDKASEGSCSSSNLASGLIKSPEQIESSRSHDVSELGRGPLSQADGQEKTGGLGVKKISSHGHESVIRCPNKYNIYHLCGQFCRDRYTNVESKDIEPTIEQRRQLAVLLKTFPLTNDWTVVFDPGVRTFYFWNTTTNHVSWVPPGISAFASPPANQIRKAYLETNRTQAHDTDDQNL